MQHFFRERTKPGRDRLGPDLPGGRAGSRADDSRLSRAWAEDSVKGTWRALRRLDGAGDFLYARKPMHEMSIAQSLIGIVSEEMAKHGATRLVSVRVRHGALAAVVPHALTFAWEALTQEGPLAGARLDMEEIPVLLRCSSCGREFTPAECDRLLLIPCPACGEDLGHEVLEGKELYIENLEAE